MLSLPISFHIFASHSLHLHFPLSVTVITRTSLYIDVLVLMPCVSQVKAQIYMNPCIKIKSKSRTMHGAHTYGGIAIRQSSTSSIINKMDMQLSTSDGSSTRLPSHQGVPMHAAAAESDAIQSTYICMFSSSNLTLLFHLFVIICTLPSVATPNPMGCSMDSIIP